jgi:hypothetical protein
MCYLIGSQVRILKPCRRQFYACSHMSSHSLSGDARLFCRFSDIGVDSSGPKPDALPDCATPRVVNM